MKDKILNALKTKYKDLGFSDNAFTGVAELLATTTTEEANIETGISGVQNLLKAFQSEIDSRVNSAVKKAKEGNPKPTGGDPEPELIEPQPVKPGAKKDETPEWAKAIIESNKMLSDKLAALEGEKVKQSRKEILSSKLKEAPDVFKNQVLKSFSRMSFENDESFNEYITELETDTKDAIQNFADEGLSGFGKPNNGGGGGKKEATDEDRKALLDDIM